MPLHIRRGLSSPLKPWKCLYSMIFPISSADSYVKVPPPSQVRALPVPVARSNLFSGTCQVAAFSTIPPIGRGVQEIPCSMACKLPLNDHVVSEHDVPHRDCTRSRGATCLITQGSPGTLQPSECSIRAFSSQCRYSSNKVNIWIPFASAPCHKTT